MHIKLKWPFFLNDKEGFLNKIKHNQMRALIIVDAQNDFFAEGALPTPDGDKVVPIINKIIDDFPLVLASRDWHPHQTNHFEKWPVHCVRETPGADFHPDLDTEKIDQELLKGTSEQGNGYSAFEATNVDLVSYLRSKGINELYITGLSTEHSVKATAEDAIKYGFTTYVVEDAVKGINASPKDAEQALKEMLFIGVRIIRSTDIISILLSG
jgi:nicotinamidase/pyrazinamidase